MRIVTSEHIERIVMPKTPAQLAAQQRYRESEKGRTRTSGVDGRGRVQLVRQLSNAACIEGRTWGRDARGVWVTDGCRAEFRSW